MAVGTQQTGVADMISLTLMVPPFSEASLEIHTRIRPDEPASSLGRATVVPLFPRNYLEKAWLLLAGAVHLRGFSHPVPCEPIFAPHCAKRLDRSRGQTSRFQ